MADPYVLPFMTAQKTPRGGDHAMEFTLAFLAGEFINVVQLVPFRLIAEYAYPVAFVLSTMAQKRPS